MSQELVRQVGGVSLATQSHYLIKRKFWSVFERVFRVFTADGQRLLTTGGMLVTVEVQVPKDLNGKARNAIEDLREATAGADPREELLERAKEA